MADICNCETVLMVIIANNLNLSDIMIIIRFTMKVNMGDKIKPYLKSPIQPAFFTSVTILFNLKAFVDKRCELFKLS